jgi:hypothetical protein
MKNKGFIRSWLLISMAAFLVLSCGGGGGGGGESGGGGGGGGGGSAVPSFQPAGLNTKMTVDQSHGVKATGLAFVSHQVGGIAGSGDIVPFSQNEGDQDFESTPALIDAILQLAEQQIEIDFNGQYSASGTASETQPCPDGGSTSVALQWTGPEPPTTCSQIQNLSGNMTLSGCTDGNMYMNGTVQVSYSGTFCRPTGLTNTFTNFTYSDGNDQMQTTQLRVSATNLNWSGNLPYGAITGGHFVYNGQVIATMDGQSVALAFSDYVEDLSGSSLQVSGNLYGPCLGGWATLSTPTPILLGYDDACPTAGRIVIAGASGATMEVRFNNDGSVSVNGANIGSCDDLDPTCPAP